MSVQTLWNGRRIDVNRIETYRFSPLEFCHPLAQIARYAGNTIAPYSVAEHSVLLASAVPAHLRKVALMHDFSEVFLSDIPNPTKRLFPAVIAFEQRIQRHLCALWNIPWVRMLELGEYDSRICQDEMSQITVAKVDTGREPLGVTCRCLPWEVARDQLAEAIAA